MMMEKDTAFDLFSLIVMNVAIHFNCIWRNCIPLDKFTFYKCFSQRERKWWSKNCKIVCMGCTSVTA